MAQAKKLVEKPKFTWEELKAFLKSKGYLTAANPKKRKKTLISARSTIRRK